VREFETGHGYRPNLLQISPQHFSDLQSSLPEFIQREEMTRFLGMRIIFSQETTHPHVAWIAIAEVESA
jgi:hypothetical protein